MTEAFSTTCAVHRIVGGWWLSGCHNSVVENWQLKPGCPGFNCWPFRFPIFVPHNIKKCIMFTVYQPLAPGRPIHSSHTPVAEQGRVWLDCN